MSAIDRTIVELNKRIQNAEAQNQQMERRIKELESQTNSLGIIEPANEGSLILGITKIEEFSVLNESNPGAPGFGGAVKFSIEPDPSINQDKWPIFKFPIKVRQPDVIVLPKAEWRIESGEGELPIISYEIVLIEDDFEIDEVTWNDVQSFTTVRFNRAGFLLTPPTTIEGDRVGKAEFPFEKPTRLGFDNDFIARFIETLFTGFLIRDIKDETVGADKSKLDTSDFELDLDDPNQRAFYIPNEIFKFTVK